MNTRKTMASLEQNQKVEHVGDLIIQGDVASGAEIRVKDGSLTIEGSVGNDAVIQIEVTPQQVNSSNLFSGVIIPKNSFVSIGKISVIGSQMYINGVLQTQGASTVSAPVDSASKLIVKGSVGDRVNMTVYKDIEIGGPVGSTCVLESEFGYVMAHAIGEGSEIKANKDIHVTDVADRARLCSEYGKVSALLLISNVSVDANKQIVIAGSTGDACILTSQYAGIEISNVGKHVQIKANKDIEAAVIGDNASLISQYGSISVTDVGMNVTIKANKKIKLNSVGQSSSLESEYDSIWVITDVHERVNIKANKSISARHVSADCEIKSEYASVQVASVNDRTRIAANKNVEVVGYCASSAKLKSDYGKVRKPSVSIEKPPVLFSPAPIPATLPNPAPVPVSDKKNEVDAYLTGRYEGELAHAINLSQADALKKLNLFPAAPKPVEQVQAPQLLDQEVPEAYVCPLSLEIMQNPVFCLLDDNTYEESWIREALALKKESPLTRAPMLPEQTIDSVLKVNRNLKDAIQAYLKAAKKPEVAAPAANRL